MGRVIALTRLGLCRFAALLHVPQPTEVDLGTYSVHYGRTTLSVSLCVSLSLCLSVSVSLRVSLFSRPCLSVPVSDTSIPEQVRRLLMHGHRGLRSTYVLMRSLLLVGNPNRDSEFPARTFRNSCERIVQSLDAETAQY
jgi:hypothetical protein